ncbi:hypothetical protein OIU78_018350 [Salix suchowensis]|nr:hypothetical protein OIU78_018350 [Salix suchowensis]
MEIVELRKLNTSNILLSGSDFKSCSLDILKDSMLDILTSNILCFS